MKFTEEDVPFPNGGVTGYAEKEALSRALAFENYRPHRGSVRPRVAVQKTRRLAALEPHSDRTTVEPTRPTR